MKKKYRKEHIYTLFDNALMNKEDYEFYLTVPLNDSTEEDPKSMITLQSLIQNESINEVYFEDLASLGVEILIRDVNYANLHNRIKKAILLDVI